ncbi:phage neck terminator protein [Commensalibacter communis]
MLKSSQVKAKAPKDNEFPALKTLTHEEIYNLIAKFMRKAIPIKGARLSIINDSQNRTSTPKSPYITLQITERKRLSTPETRYTDQYKITWCRSQVSVHILFVGSLKIPALEMAHAFDMRFNDAWASEQFEQYSDILFPLYSDDVSSAGQMINAEDQIDVAYSVNAYFEYHPETGICANSAKEIVLDMGIVES